MTTTVNADIRSNQFMGNPKLRHANTEIEYTKDELENFIRCQNDIIHFSEHIKIQHPDKGLITFSPYEYQQNLIPLFQKERFVIVKNPRQTGKTTCAIAFLLHYILTNRNKTIAILTNKGDTSREVLMKLQLAYENLPKYLQQGIVAWNKGSIELENGCRVMALSTTSSAARSYSFAVIYIDEMAFIENRTWEPFWKSVYPTISSGTETKVILVSTPNGLNHFYKFWSEANDNENDFVPFGVHWSDVPGRDEKWKRETIRQVGMTGWRQEFECEFVGSSNTLIDAETLQNLKFEKPQHTNKKETLKIYKTPNSRHAYLIVADTSEGVGEDFCASSVIDITQEPYEVVATFRDNELSPLEFPNVLHDLSLQYNKAYILCENNSIGYQVCYQLRQELENENTLSTETRGRAGQRLVRNYSRKTNLGVKMSPAVKKTGCAILKRLVEGEKLKFKDFDIISELTTFAKNTKGTFEADEGHNDDLVDGLLLFAWATSQDLFKELISERTSNFVNVEQKGLSELDEIELPTAPHNRWEPAIDTSLADPDFDDGVWIPVEHGNPFY